MLLLSSLLLGSMMISSAPSGSSIPRYYVCYRADAPIRLDGNLNDPAWKNAPWTHDFVDIQGPPLPNPRFQTRAKMLWDDKYLYIGAEMVEPNVWATLKEHDSVIFHDNDFEVFLDPNNCGAPYIELEMNALNTTWDLLLPHPYRGGGPPLTGWNIKGLKTAVHIEGKLNDPAHPTKGWSVEIAIPWSGISEVCSVPCPPINGDQWRINFSRVEWHVHVANGQYVKNKGVPEDNWVWSPQGVIDMHRPEHWGVLQFSDQHSGQVHLRPVSGWQEKIDMVKVWEAEQNYRRKNGVWTDSLSSLGIDMPGIKIYHTPTLLEIVDKNWHVDQSLRFWHT